MAETEEIQYHIESLVSNYRTKSLYLQSATPAKLQRTDEAILYASFLQVLPLTKLGGKVEQNLILLNYYVIKTETIDSSGYNLESFISRSLSEVPEVEYIFTAKEENKMNVWIVMNQLNREAREKIYDIEYNILGQFNDTYFDFHVICREDRDIYELLPRNTIMIYRGNI